MFNKTVWKFEDIKKEINTFIQGQIKIDKKDVYVQTFYFK